ncbi:MAG: DUF3631 domain-containing protein [Armatimonadetes bacterium]|nr:DUF3631 domain-containing protein [Armatimonadota bacterium]
MRIEFGQMAPERSIEEVWEDLEKQFEQSPTAEITQNADSSGEIARLAGMDPLAYDRERVSVAKALGIRVSTLDEQVQAFRKSQADEGTLILADPAPWPEPVDCADLLTEISDTVQRRVRMPDGGAEATALFVYHAHAHDAAEISPILGVTSPTPECGKSVLVTIIGCLVPRPLSASNITAASVFRAVEEFYPTLLVDEADTFLRDNDELRGVLNSGHMRAAAYVVRCVGDDHKPVIFRTWCPKAIAMIGDLPATLLSRSIQIKLKRLSQDESVVPLRLHELGMFEPLRRKAARSAQDHLEDLRRHEPDMPPELRGRAADNWRPLLSIADLAGGGWPQRARQAAVALSGHTSDQIAGIMLLEDLWTLFQKLGDDRLSTWEILSKLNTMDHRPWPEWNKGRELSGRGLAKLLSPFGIVPRTIRRGDGTPKGYLREQFEDAFNRYLSEEDRRDLDGGPEDPQEAATPPHPASDADSSGFTPATDPSDVAGDSIASSVSSAACGGVADGEPPPADGIGNGPAISDLSEEARSVWKEIRRDISILDFSSGEVKFPGPPASRPRGRSPVPKHLQKRVLRLASELVPRLRWEAAAEGLIYESTERVNSILGLRPTGCRVLQDAPLWSSYKLRLEEAVVAGDMGRVRELLDDRERYARFLADT